MAKVHAFFQYLTLGRGIDAATGAIMKPEFKYYDLEFEKIEDEASE